MSLSNMTTHPARSWDKLGLQLLLIAVLLLALIGSFALAARTPWTLDQPAGEPAWMIQP
ncbi:MAG: hypothetical protein IPO81_28355 [Kouleothrix sp.]|nr:hypothetical protein [Kouleothrix sp.]